MNIVNSVEFKTYKNTYLELDLINDNYDDSRPFYTVITGENGSYKSVILKKIAENAIYDEYEIPNSYDVHFHIKNPETFKVIAYSGASIDRYPLIKARSRFALNLSCYTYLGQKAGANIISRRQPFETMLTEAFSGEKILRVKEFFFKKSFSQVNLQPKITFILSPNKLSNKTLAFGSLYDLLQYSSSSREYEPSIKRGLFDRDLAKYLLNQYQESDFFELEKNYRRKFKIDFSEDGINKLGPELMRIIRLGLLVDMLRISSAEVTSLKTGEEFSLYDLSTGEFNMLTSILGLGFSVEHNAIVLIDEPEVSLHPQWQVEFISIINKIFNNYKVSHVLISTHSPLIVSSITDNCLIVDLSRDGEPSEEKNSLYGASTDEILINHFGLATGRNFFVIDTLQQAVNLIEDDKENTPEFRKLIPELNKIQNSLSDNDPMIEVIKTVVSYAN